MVFQRDRERSVARFRRRALAAAALLALCCGAAAPSRAATGPNLVTNGTFAVTGTSTSFQFSTFGGYSPPGTVAGWSTTGYNFVFLPGSYTANDAYGSQNLTLWGPHSSPTVANGFTYASPTGGDYVAADSDYGTEPITQTINNLVPGHGYVLSFAWAGAQQSGFTGATTDSWTVQFGAQVGSTQTISLPSQGFSGWMNATFFFIASATSQVLSFDAVGTPAGVPPFALLSSVALVDVPEPASTAVLLTGLAGAILVIRRRRAMAGGMRPAATPGLPHAA